jgi:transcription-repair coupling factor (superfamily II helicase)
LQVFNSILLLKSEQFIQHFAQSENTHQLTAFVNETGAGAIALRGMAGSAPAVIAASVIRQSRKSFLFILSERESAAYFFNDLENLLGERELSYENRNIFLFPASFKKPYEVTETDNANVLLRSEVVNRLASQNTKTIIVTYPEALGEKVVPRKVLKKNVIAIVKGESLSVDFLLDVLLEYGFERAEFVVEPGEFSLRGGIIDVFSFSNDFPFRIEIMGDTVESLRSFNPETQLSVKVQDKISILPDIGQMEVKAEGREFLLDSLPGNTVVWCEDTNLTMEKMKAGLEKASNIFFTLHKDFKHTPPEELFMESGQFIEKLKNTRLVEFRKASLAKGENQQLVFDFSPQPSFNKNFELLIRNLEGNSAEGITNLLLSDNPRQIERIHSIFETIHENAGQQLRFHHDALLLSLHEGFIDHQSRLACYTDHQIFERYHRFKVRDKFPGKQALTIKDFQNLKPGDYITHIDHGIGIFSGLEKIEVNGKLQEAIRLVYKDNDVLYISIHSLHRISRYSGKEGAVPTLHRLGSNAWANLKNKTKSKVKDIAKDLINLYAKRRAQQGFGFAPDTYLQNELEASFIYEDTPDQEKAIIDVKKDMEALYPMDRLICGDVGFGKTEVAIRAAFKAVADSKQVAVLVPTTILALQHYYTFSDRLKDLPCRVDYISRFRTAKEKKQVIEDLKAGKIDIIIGTHRLVSKDIKFKDIGLLIIDEEQKFGVAAKEKLKQIRLNVDTLTLTATPIPRTLQFSMMGARDLSLINTPPPNRYPIVTELHIFNEELIRDAIMNEVGRNGQVFFIHNRVQNIIEMAGTIQRLCPDVSVAVGHGQMEGSKLEKIMVDFINGDYDVLVATTIVESGLDIPNANTIIINNAHHFGLSDLHQMRGRVGRTNKKAFCYLLTPPMSTLTDEARKRLRAIEEFSDLGSGFNISMRDLDIRGAGNLLGAEQSGFIAEIGFEMYQKILDEAITELKEKEFKELFAEGLSQQKYLVGDCQLETDFELMIPSDYVSNTEERLSLYKELDSIGDETALDAFAKQVIDRFGPMPEATYGLLQAVRLRWTARKIGFEKIILKSGILIGYFISRQDSPYFESPAFKQVLRFAQENYRKCQLKESNQRLSLTIKPINDIGQALELTEEIMATSVEI